MERQASLRSSRPYVRISDIASGGVGHVALAVKKEGSFERLYAVKRLRAEHREDADFRTMFFDEARLAGCVRHANVVSVIDVGEDDEGPFLVMDYVEGVPLSAIVRHAQRADGGVPMQIALRIVIEAARGLHAAHEALGPDGAPLALVHRDVSPQNILVGFDGVTRVTDFGVAKAFGRTTQTVTGVLKGKLGYMSPEQLRFEALDRRADVFALGVVLYEVLSAVRLYRSVDEYDGVRRILEEPPPDIGEVREDAPPKLVELVFAMLGKKREQRPATADEVARVLDEVLGEVEASEGKRDVSRFVREAFAVERELQSSRAKRRPADDVVTDRTPKPTSRRWVAIATVLAVVVVIATGALWLGPWSASLGAGDAPPAQIAVVPSVPPIAPPEDDPPIALPHGDPLAGGAPITPPIQPVQPSDPPVPSTPPHVEPPTMTTRTTTMTTRMGGSTDPGSLTWGWQGEE